MGNTNRPSRGHISESEMKAAISLVLEGRGVKAVAKETGIYRITLKHYVRKPESTRIVCKTNFVTT